MAKRVNTSPLTAREGEVYVDGQLIADSCVFKVVFKPDVWEGKELGRKGTSRRWIGYDIEVQIEQWKTNNFYRKKIDEYIQQGVTPEMKITGVQEDKNSDYYDANGSLTITCIGCVPKDDINLMDCDTDGDVVKESITLGAFDIV